jgi:hypothetical protein
MGGLPSDHQVPGQTLGYGAGSGSARSREEDGEETADSLHRAPVTRRAAATKEKSHRIRGTGERWLFLFQEEKEDGRECWIARPDPAPFLIVIAMLKQDNALYGKVWVFLCIRSICTYA